MSDNHKEEPNLAISFASVVFAIPLVMIAFLIGWGIFVMFLRMLVVGGPFILFLGAVLFIYQMVREK